VRLERLLSLPAVLVGGGLMYVGYFEADVLYIFFYFLLGSILAFSGILLLLGHGLGAPSKKELEEFKNEETKPVQPELKTPDFCQNCGAPILSAGKFCGNCGKPTRYLLRR
jgi:hypothetical protein